MVIKENIIVMIDYLFVFTSSNSFFFYTKLFILVQIVIVNFKN